ncbi:hypothetical protein [Isoptericola sp. G70]|uniref:hypothetical protein n=1 Tax=Isoptericola sp. G70 TaxID=3376633 RepID=UPI003A80CCFE
MTADIESTETATEDTAPETPEVETTEPETPGETETEPETFPREYVQKLRDESAKYRQRAGKTDELAKRLHTSLVAATGRLADPSDLPYDEAHLDDEEALTAAVDALLASKPHLASRKPMGDVGQGASGDGNVVGLAGLLRAGAA